MNQFHLRGVADAQLLGDVRVLVRRGNELTAELLAHLGEIEVRGLHLDAGCSSMFGYCTEVLRMSEGAAYKRIGAARAARKYPVILSLVASGEIHLTGVCDLAPHLTDENHGELLRAARHKSKRDIAVLLAERFPRPAVPPSLRRLPTPRPACSPSPSPSPAPSASASPPPPCSDQSVLSAPSPSPSPSPPRPRPAPAVIEPLAPARYRLALTLDQKVHDKLLQARALLSHQVPDGDLNEILDRALTLLVAERMKTKFASRDAAPRSRARVRKRARRTRHIPSHVKREVLARDGARCAFVGVGGHRCTETRFLELDHVVPYARGGLHVAENIRVVCRLCRMRHKRHYAELGFMPRSVCSAHRERRARVFNAA